MDEEVDDAESCSECQAFYDFGIEVFTYELFAESFAGPLAVSWPISYTKSWSKEKTFLAGPVPINLGVALEGEIGIELGLSLTAKWGDQEPVLAPNLCAVSRTQSRCGMPSPTPDDPGVDGDQSCYCDLACSFYGDCCEDYAYTCQFGGMPRKVVATSDFCASDGCHDSMAGKNMVATVAATVTPFTGVTLEAWAGLDLAVIRVLVKGEVTLVDLQVPFVLSGHMGFVGTPTVVESFSMYGDFGADLTASFLAGRVYLALEHINLSWCGKGPFKVPCGFQYDEFWSIDFASWDGIPLDLKLFAASIGGFTIDFGQDWKDCTDPWVQTPVCTRAAPLGLGLGLGLLRSGHHRQHSDSLGRPAGPLGDVRGNRE